jgi:hypothetical protein
MKSSCCIKTFLFCILLLLCITVHPDLSSSAVVPDTGVTSCFDDQGLEIVCPETGQPFHGQDAHYGPGAMILTSNGDGTISDTNTTLMWEVKGIANGSPDPTNPNNPDNTYRWDELTTFVSLLNSTNYGGYSDWRIPTVKELESLLDLSIAEPGPTTDMTLFPNCKAGSYWTSDLDIDNPAMAWSIDFSNSLDNITATSDLLYVRAVRGGL